MTHLYKHTHGVKFESKIRRQNLKDRQSHRNFESKSQSLTSLE